MANDGAFAELEALILATRSQPAAPGQAPQDEVNVEHVNWSSHKKEGMRLTRLLDSRREEFPHMSKLWDGNKKDWVHVICVSGLS